MDKTAPIFIVGAPRSGTTLVYQVIAAVLDVGYINNFIARFWKRPVLGAYLSERIFRIKRPGGDYTSHMGRTRGWSGVHEFGYFWNRFMPIYDQDHHYVRHLSRVVRAELRAEVDGMSRIFRNKPMAFKNLTCGLRIEPLCRTFAEPKFLVICRDRNDTIRSILQCRHEAAGNEDAWFSLAPADVAQIKRISDPRRQVEAQVESIYRCIAGSVTLNTMTIQYEDFITNPLCHVIQISKEWGIPFRQTFKLDRDAIAKGSRGGCCE